MLSNNIFYQKVSADIEAGTYPYTIKTANGYQKNDINVLQRNVYNDNTYDSKILPLIVSLNSNFVSPKG